MSRIPTTLLGKTGLEVSRLGMGGLFLASFAGDLARAQAAVEHAVACGVTLIDTAPGYHDSETVIGKILPEISEPLLVSTKLGGRPQPFEPQNRDHLLRSVDESLRAEATPIPSEPVARGSASSAAATSTRPGPRSTARISSPPSIARTAIRPPRA